MNKVRWGILGPGKIAEDFASDFHFVPDAELVAVASRSEDRAKSFASNYNISKVYGDYKKLYIDDDVDVIYIATPHSFHFEQTKSALEAGKAVLCEKPITTNSKDLEYLMEVARSNNCYLMEGMWSYFLPVLKKAVEWVNSGRIGKLLHLKSEFGYAVPFDANSRMYNPDLAGGALLDMGIYNVAMTRLFGLEESMKMSVRSFKASTGVDEDVVIRLDGPSQTAHLHTSFRCKLPNFTHLIGEKGYIEIPKFWQARICSLYEGDALVEEFIDEREGVGFSFEIAAVTNDIKMGRKMSEVVPHDTSMYFQQFMEKIVKEF